MSASITIKRGDTFRLELTYQDGVPEVPTSLTAAGATPRSEVRRSGAMVQDLTVTIADQAAFPGVFYLSATARETKKWPVGQLATDVQITYDNEDVVSWPTMQIVVLEDITQ